MKPPSRNLVAVVFTAALLGLAGTGAFVTIVKGQALDQSFKDCADCTEMVVIPAGRFQMGSPKHWANEHPVHDVRIKRFALGKYEVTFAEYDACVAAGGCPREADDEDWGRVRRPVINVSWNDAVAYVAWLSRNTGKPYRLASESEWEYAARAGTRTSRYWGDDADKACEFANVHDRKSKSVNRFAWPYHGCDDGYAKTAPVGSFRANAFGLHDMLGNVWEWVEDCWQFNYVGAPTEGEAWTLDVCPSRVLRGGAWDFHPRVVRAANRYGVDTGNRSYDSGFRVAGTY